MEKAAPSTMHECTSKKFEWMECGPTHSSIFYEAIVDSVQMDIRRMSVCALSQVHQSFRLIWKCWTIDNAGTIAYFKISHRQKIDEKK